MRRRLVAVVALLSALPFGSATAHADCAAPGSVDPAFIPDLSHPTHPGYSAGGCVNLGPAGVVTVGNVTSVRSNDPADGTGAGSWVIFCHSGFGCAPVGVAGAGWYPSANPVVVVGTDGARLDAGRVTVWPASWSGEHVPVCVTTNPSGYNC